MRGQDMGRFWDARAREDAFYFVDNRLEYQAPDVERFWADGKAELGTWLDEMDVRVGPTDVVLDLGCGVGRMTRALAGWAGQVVGLDISREMLARARALNSDLEGVSWVHGDGVSLAGIETASVDGCVSVVVFQHLPDPALTLGYVGEIGRVLRAGGWAAVQFSNDASVHHGRDRSLRRRLRSVARPEPEGQDHAAWLGSAVELTAFRDAVRDAGMAVEGVWGEGTLFCRARLRRDA